MAQPSPDALAQRGLVLGPLLGKGTYGQVFQCTSVRNQKSYALKVISTRQLKMRGGFDEAKVMREVLIMRQLRHPGLVSLVDAFSTPDCLYLIMELVVGIDLFDLVVAKGGLDERACQFLFHQLVTALAYLHSQGIIHRDIKPENIIVSNREGDAEADAGLDTGNVAPGTRLKIIDFGLAKSFGETSAASYVGSPHYIAPEIVALAGTTQRTATTTAESIAVDAYAAGVVLYVMLCCHFPAFVQNDENKDQVVFELGTPISANAQDLIRSLTAYDPAQRITLANALNHPFLANAPRSIAVGGQNGSIVASQSRSFDEVMRLVSQGNRLQLLSPSAPPDIAMLPQVETALLQTFATIYRRVDSNPALSLVVRTGYVHCRTLLQQSQLLISQLGNTGVSVLQLVPDIALSVSEGERDATLLGLINSWVGDHITDVRRLVDAHSTLATEVHEAIDSLKREQNVSDVERQAVEIDRQLMQSTLLWRNIELALGVLRQRTNVVVALLPQTHSPALRERFLARLKDLEVLWQGVVALCGQISLQTPSRGVDVQLLDDVGKAAGGQ